jgi:hypothetical protein
MKKSSTFKIFEKFLFTMLALFVAASLVNCGGSSGPAQVEAPKTLIQDYIAKHETMVDMALVKFYATAEQPAIAAAVKKTIDEMKAAGELEKLQQTTFDFSNTKIAVVGEREAYVDDQPTKVIKVSVSGSYVMKQDDGSKTVPADETIILEMVDNSWKVTEKINPWS